MTENSLVGDDWVPAACTLPTLDQPLRRKEFDILFAEDVTRVERASSGRLHLDLRAAPDSAARAAELAVKETDCCSFFSFGLSIGDGKVVLTVSTEEAHADVLAALGDRATARMEADE